MCISKICWQVTALAFLVCLSTSVQGEDCAKEFSGGTLNFANFLPIGSQFPSETIIGNSECYSASHFKLTGGTSEIVRTDLFRVGGTIALQLKGTLKKLSKFHTAQHDIVFARPTSDISRFSNDFIELNGDSVSLLDILSGENLGMIGGWDYNLIWRREGSYYLLDFYRGDGSPELTSFSITSQSAGLLVHASNSYFIPEPSSLTLLLVSVVFCGTNTRIARRLR